MALVIGTNCGFVSAAPTADPSATETTIDNRCWVAKFTTPVGCTNITEIGFYVMSLYHEAADFQIAIYTHNSGADAPDAVVGTIHTGNVITANTPGWYKYTGLNIAVSAETVYWIGVGVEDTTSGDTNTQRGDTSDSRCGYIDANNGVLPSPWTGFSAWDAIPFAFYALYGAGGGGDISLPLTGVSGTASVGAVALSLAMALSGVVGTGAVGTLGPDVTVPISGVEAPASVGTMSPMQAAVLAGIEAVDAAGGMSQSVEIPVSGNSTGMTYPISGTEAIGEVGAVMAEVGVGPDITIPLTGVSANPAYQLSGVAAAGEVGTVSPNIEAVDIILPLTGVFGTGAVGDVVYLELGGWAATGEIGNVTPNVSPPIAGNEAAAAVGDAIPGRTVGLNGVAATGVPGGWGVISRPFTGMDGISDVGTLTPLISGVITGNAATTAKGSVTQEHTVALVGIAGTGVAGYMDSLMEGDVVRPLTGVYATGRAGTVTCGTASPNYIHVKPRKRILTVTPRHRIITVSRRRF